VTDYIDDIFGEHGALAAKFSGYQPRPGQVALARHVDAAIARVGHLLAEAPTGTGKSISYAVPAIYHATQNNKTAIIVTANIALQEQLVRKDLPLLAEILPWKFRYALLKGKNNYLCNARFNDGTIGKLDPLDTDMNQQLIEWAENTLTGDMSELPFEPPARLWGRYSISSDDCTGKECEYYDACYSEAARAQAKEAHVVVTNYHLFFADMRVREITNGQVSILPDYGVAILDEGHKAVDIARDFFGFRISEGSLRWAGALLPTEEKLKLERAQSTFFTSLMLHKKSGLYKARIRKPQAVDSKEITQALSDAEEAYVRLLRPLLSNPDATADDRKQIKKISTRCDRVVVLRDQINAAMKLYATPSAPWLLHPEAPQGTTPETRWYWSDPALGGNNSVKNEAQLITVDDVFFIEEEFSRVALCSKPVSVAKLLREHLFTAGPSISVTSATLAVRNAFDYVANDLGVDKPATLIAQSPFNWREQMLLVLPLDVPEPTHPTFVAAAAEKCAQTIEMAKGRTLALFTSYKNMNAAHERALKTGYRILRQGDMPRTSSSTNFEKTSTRCCLVSSHFGQALTCLANPFRACSLISYRLRLLTIQ
jgi:ATP-dependent DNA helicase DinG